MLFTNKQTDKPSLPKTQPPLFICLYSLKLNDNKHSRFCKVTHTRDFHGLQLVQNNMLFFLQNPLHEIGALKIDLSVSKIPQRKSYNRGHTVRDCLELQIN